jgi:hypothetical protein
VDHHRLVPGLVRAGVAQAEPLWLVEVELHGRQGGLPAVGVGDLYVDLRPVERGLARDLVEGAEHVGVVELDGSYPGEPAQNSGQFGAVHPAQLGDAQLAPGLGEGETAISAPGRSPASSSQPRASCDAP